MVPLKFIHVLGTGAGIGRGVDTCRDVNIDCEISVG
jgi:hypothetical protein